MYFCTSLRRRGRKARKPRLGDNQSSWHKKPVSTTATCDYVQGGL